MLPNHVLSSQPIIGYYLYPDNLDPDPLKSWELGGVGLNDPSEGLQVQTWWARLHKDGIKETAIIYIGADSVPEFVWLSNADFTEVSLAFDQNMNPFVSYMVGGVAKFYWYDTALPGYTTTTLPAGSRSPKCCLDDKREMQDLTNDIILAYMRDDKLYYREQRDRYTVEYLLSSGHGLLDLIQVGMNTKLRLQFALGFQEYPAGEINYRVTVTGNQRVTVDGSKRRLVKRTYG